MRLWNILCAQWEIKNTLDYIQRDHLQSVSQWHVITQCLCSLNSLSGRISFLLASLPRSKDVWIEALLDPVMHEVPHTDSRSRTQRDMKATCWASESHSLIRLADAGGQHDSWNDGSNLRPTVFFCLVCFSCVRVICHMHAPFTRNVVPPPRWVSQCLQHNTLHSAMACHPGSLCPHECILHAAAARLVLHKLLPERDFLVFFLILGNLTSWQRPKAHRAPLRGPLDVFPPHGALMDSGSSYSLRHLVWIRWVLVCI